MPSLLKLEQELLETEAEILSCYDEETGEQIQDDIHAQTHLSLIRTQIEIKKENYTRLLKNKFFSKLENKINDQIKKLQKEKQWLNERKDLIELAFHNAVAKKPFEVIGEDGNIELYVSTDYSIQNSVDMSKVSSNDGIYMVKMTPEQFKDFRTLCLKDKEPEQYKQIVTVTDIGKEHPAIVSRVRPTVKITKTKPK